MEAEGLSIRAIMGLLRRRILVVITGVALALAVALVALFLMKPVYTSSALVIVDPVKRDLLDRTDPTDAGWSSSRIDAETELIISLSAFRTVAERLGLADNPEFSLRQSGLREWVTAFFGFAPPADTTHEDALDNAANALLDKIEVRRRDLTNLIDIAASSEDPALAAKIANEVAKVYVERQLEAKVQSVLSARTVISERLGEASSTMAGAERAFDYFVETSVERIASETGRTDLATLRAELADATTRGSALGAKLGQVETGLAGRDWAAIAAGLETETVSNLASEREAVARQLALLPAGSPGAVDLNAQVQRLESALADEAGRALATLRQEIDALKARADIARASLRDQVLTSNLPTDVLTSLYELRQAAEISRAQYETLLTRQQDLETQAYLQLPDSRIVSEAGASSTPSFPRPSIFLALALVVGLAVGIAAAFLIENFVGGITSEEQAETVLRTMVVASIPRQKPASRPNASAPASVADALLLAPLSGYSESIRRMRIGLDQSILRSTGTAEAERTAGIAIMVTSTSPNEGKTTVALSLARAYALSGRATLLIDCDLRKPGLHRQLGLEPSDGLIDYLSNRKHVGDFQAFVIEDPGSGAQVVLGSRRADVPTDQLVAGKTFAVLVAAARRNFDVVVLDAPPVGPVVDALYMAGLSDVVAYVIKWSETPLPAIKRALESLQRVKPDKVQVLAVINQLDKVPVGYQGRYSEYYLES
jgi:uncharacterized protein involved in exopolysaccharide biosynthesis/Mrp family chromosome partitioning ATPase